ncbi:response regulator [Pseudoalteromonas shioyasakiensis]|uniref:Response regulator n=1 Tax=Pseudoalteromonas shioyasakiensis TaxID=1190813 RepID=A0ABT6TWT6_9GAMM|nr:MULTISPECIES: response regulator [Pseudoalteromonas]MDI4668052.1 response regulator [Pseudoalteromonas shioyasakiensis]MDI4672718.1 response regulator [Pseudoalteromonas shioyasakiensis]MDI4684782.1 response regulator [Pseudoalteromonas shioyasakiensis]MDI4703254.1 response regulator [Pseudoalteromonas shioyasakiensis]NUJ20119.1 response regulator [Pseudoalteromonas sp. 0802]
MKKNIVIIDDDEAILRSLKRLLSTNNHVICFSDPLSAIEYAKQNPISLVICDLLMPAVSGFAVLEDIKLLQPNCSRLLITGYAELEASKSALNNNIANMITAKPWDNFELTMLVDILIENSHLKLNQCLENVSS